MVSANVGALMLTDPVATALLITLVAMVVTFVVQLRL
jgi:hypothetical protein